jgi:two-component system response regulator
VSTRELNVLLIEDNPEHARLIQLILDRKNIRAHVHVVRDGVEAMSLLSQSSLQTRHEKTFRPDLILLDFNMPRVDGRNVLRQVKASSSLRDIPVVVVSTSEKEEDRVYAAREGATAYLSKSAGFDVFSEMLSKIAASPQLTLTNR